MSNLYKKFQEIRSEQDREQKEDEERKRIEKLYCMDDGKEEYVWLVESGHWEDYQLIAICSTKEKAEKIKNIYNEYYTYELASVQKVRINVKL